MTKGMIEEGWVQEEDHDPNTVMEMEPEVPLLTSCPVLWEKNISCHFQSHFWSPGSGLICPSLWRGQKITAQNGDSYLCREKGKAGEKEEGQKVSVQNLDKLLSPRGTPSFSFSQRKLLSLVNIKQQRWAILKTTAEVIWELS